MYLYETYPIVYAKKDLWCYLVQPGVI